MRRLSYDKIHLTDFLLKKGVIVKDEVGGTEIHVCQLCSLVVTTGARGVGVHFRRADKAHATILNEWHQVRYTEQEPSKDIGVPFAGHRQIPISEFAVDHGYATKHDLGRDTPVIMCGCGVPLMNMGGLGKHVSCTGRKEPEDGFHRKILDEWNPTPPSDPKRKLLRSTAHFHIIAVEDIHQLIYKCKYCGSEMPLDRTGTHFTKGIPGDTQCVHIDNFYRARTAIGDHPIPEEGGVPRPRVTKFALKEGYAVRQGRKKIHCLICGKDCKNVASFGQHFSRAARDEPADGPHRRAREHYLGHPTPPSEAILSNIAPTDTFKESRCFRAFNIDGTEIYECKFCGQRISKGEMEMHLAPATPPHKACPNIEAHQEFMKTGAMPQLTEDIPTEIPMQTPPQTPTPVPDSEFGAGPPRQEVHPAPEPTDGDDASSAPYRPPSEAIAEERQRQGIAPLPPTLDRITPVEGAPVRSIRVIRLDGKEVCINDVVSREIIGDTIRIVRRQSIKYIKGYLEMDVIYGGDDQ